MICEVISIKFNVPKKARSGKPYTVTEFTVQPPPYKGQTKPAKTYDIFSNMHYHNKLVDLKAGDWVEIIFESSGTYKNISDITKTEKPAAPAVPNGGGYKPYNPVEEEKRQLAIARAVAIKVATEASIALLEAGGIKKTIKPEAFAEEILAMSARFEQYTSLAEDITDLTSDTSDVSASAGDDDFQEEPFPG